MVLQWARRANNDTDLDNTFNANAGEEVNTTLRINEQSIATYDDDQLQIEKAWMVEFVETKSIWTIDLVMILQHIISEGIPSELSNNKQTANRSAESEEECSSQHGQQQQHISSLSYLFCSTKFGVDETYHNLSYYEDAFSSDELRVRNLFGIAEKQCLPLLETSNLSIQVLVDIVSRKDAVAIVLLDNRILKYNNNTNDTTSSSSYAGHYVVLCGISRDERDIRCALLKKMSSSSEEENRDGGDGDGDNSNFCMVVKNPGSWSEVEFITPSIFEMAWKAKGTDQDVIFIAKSNWH
jgi:hypothetical protein